MKVIIDAETCNGHGRCYSLSPDVFDSDDEGLRLANDTRYGLAASIWSQNVSRILDLAPRIKAGTVWVNTHSVLDANMPFGGMKMSGMGREHGSAAIEEYTELKTVCIAY